MEDCQYKKQESFNAQYVNSSAKNDYAKDKPVVLKQYGRKVKLDEDSLDIDDFSQTGVKNLLSRVQIKTLVKLFQTQKLTRDQINCLTTEIQAVDET